MTKDETDEFKTCRIIESDKTTIEMSTGVEKSNSKMMTSNEYINIYIKEETINSNDDWIKWSKELSPGSY